MSEVFERSKTQGNARLVLLSLADTCSDEGVCFPSIKTIAKKANISEETTRKFLHAFEKIGLVESEERFSPVGRRTSNTYKLNLSKVGDDELTKDVLYSAVHHSRHRSKDGFVKREKVEGDGMNQFIPLPSEPVHTTNPMNQFIPSIMNHHKEPKIEPSRESSAVASHSSVELNQPNLFPTNPSEDHTSGSANAKLNSADGKETAPHCAAPPRNKKSSATQIEKPAGVSDQVWDDFLAHRKAKRAPLSQTALTVIAREAEKASVTLEEALIVCLTRGWQGFNAEWMKKTTGFTKPEKLCNI
jgi:DNA-binding transcriptional regulator YhcF (GntR family)